VPQKRREILIQFSQLSDALLIAFVFWFAHAVRQELSFWYPPASAPIGPFDFEFSLIAPFRYYKWLYLVVLPLYPLLLDINGYYDRSRRGQKREIVWIVIKSVAVAALVVVAIMYFFALNQLSRGVILLFAVFSAGALLLKDMVFQIYLQRQAARGRHAQTAILVGSAQGNVEFEIMLAQNPDWNLRVLRTIDPARESLQQLPEMLHRNPVDCVIFNVGQTYFSEVEKAILACEIEGVEAWLIADFVKTSIARVTVDDFHGKPLLVFRTTPELSWQLMCKRLVDVVGAAVGLAVVGPLVMLPAALAIKLTSPGPILFRQKRSGLHGRLFTMYKFRSMVDNAEMLRAELEAFNEMSGPVFKMATDPRITPVGAFLRKTSIDELPQLWNVLKGDMSLVGPRPPIPSEVDKYDPWHRRRLSMKPGLTCLWQVSGRNKIGFDQWMQLDLQYIDHWSLWLDFKILLRTIPTVLSGFGAR
jgi:exopolysaccharide biosynthesis polyprenyl glycosylphosphotransferase